MAGRPGSAFRSWTSARPYAAIALLMALVERARSGQGQFIDVTLYDAASR